MHGLLIFTIQSNWLKGVKSKWAKGIGFAYNLNLIFVKLLLAGLFLVTLAYVIHAHPLFFAFLNPLYIQSCHRKEKWKSKQYTQSENT